MIKQKGEQNNMFSGDSQLLIEKAIKAEYQNAIEKYGRKYNSQHEGYAVLKEECEEAENELKNILRDLNELWQKIKNDDKDIKSLLNIIRGTALFLALEAAQIGAVADKMRE